MPVAAVARAALRPSIPKTTTTWVPNSAPAVRVTPGFLRKMSASTSLRLQNPAVFVCDIQEKFRSAIYQFDNVVTTTEKILAFAKAASIPIHCTTQTVAKLGPTVPSIAAHLTSTPIDKTNFSMLVPELTSQLKPKSSVAIVGIESHICVTQTALDLRDAGHSVYIIADAVSSCNRQEVVVALDRLRAEQGITVTSSESWMYETLGDAGHPAFKSVIGIVKNSIADTKRVLESLPPISKI